MLRTFYTNILEHLSARRGHRVVALLMIIALMTSALALGAHGINAQAGATVTIDANTTYQVIDGLEPACRARKPRRCGGRSCITTTSTPQFCASI